MAKKVQKKEDFHQKNIKCESCKKSITGGYESSNLFRLWSKYFCSISCAKDKGFQESTNIFYRIEKVIFGKK
jgi:hypothetical protein